jgi:transcription antitermination factor NusB
MESTEKNNLSKKSLMRLIACQALCMYYDTNNDNKDIDNVLENINTYYVRDSFGENKYMNLHKKDFTVGLINGVIKNSKEYDVLINKFLDKQDTVETLDDVLLQSFRLAIFELKETTVNKKIIIDEYVDIVAEFYNNVYVSFVNGVLDNIAFEIREDGRENIRKREAEQKRKILKLNKPPIS